MSQTAVVQGSSKSVPNYGSTTVDAELVQNKSAIDAADPHESDTESSSDSQQQGQDGVRTIEAISQTWSATALFIAYFGINLVAFTTSLQGQVTSPIQAYATSAFGEHSLISTILTVQEIFLAVIKPIVAKIADVFGRLESFIIAVALFVIGNIMLASAPNIATLSAAQLFYAAGSTALQLLQQIFIADTSNLLNRALFSSFPDLPFLVTVWIGSPIAEAIEKHSGWRWGYGIWPIILPVAFLPLALSLFLNQRKAKKLGLIPQSQFTGLSAFAVLKTLWLQLDFFGLVLLCASLSLILVPLTIAQTVSGGWKNHGIIASIVIGFICLVVFPFWERSPRLAPYAFFPRDMAKNRTVLAGCALAFFYFMAFYLSVQPYFYSYLLVVNGQSITAAGHITQIFSFASTCAAICVGLLIKYTCHYKYFVTLGVVIYMLGIGLMLRYRTAEASTAVLVGCQIVLGVGGGITNIPAQLGVQASVSHQQVAAATAVFLTILEIGGAVGSAISGAIWSNNLPGKLVKYLPAETRDQAALIYGNVTLASEVFPRDSPTQQAIIRAYSETMHIILICAICACVPLIPLSLTMKNYKLAKMDQKVKGRVIGGKANTKGRSEADEHGGSGSPDATETTRLKNRGSMFHKRRP